MNSQTCDYVAKMSEPKSWHGDDSSFPPGNLFKLDQSKSAGGLGVTEWHCPHPRFDQGNSDGDADEHQYCVFHTDPANVPDGVENEALLDALQEVGNRQQTDRPEHRGQFVGATFGSINLSNETIATGKHGIRFDHARFQANDGGLDFTETTLVTEGSCPISFNGAEFITNGEADVNFDGTEFRTDGKGDVNFFDATFRTNGEGDVTFESATFRTNGEGDVYFPAATFRSEGKGQVRFNKAIFRTNGEGNVRFDSGEFRTDSEGDVNFFDATFRTNGEGDVDFTRAEFRTDGVDDVYFAKAEFRTASKGNVHFSDAVFQTNGEGDLDFKLATFLADEKDNPTSGGARPESNPPTHTDVVCKVRFEAATFRANGDGKVRFFRAKFRSERQGDVMFNRSIFRSDGEGLVTFSNVTLKNVDFTGIEFGGAVLHDVNLNSTDLRNANIDDISVNGGTRCEQLHEGYEDDAFAGRFSISTRLKRPLMESKFNSRDWDTTARTYHRLKIIFSDHGLTGKARTMHVRERRARSLELRAANGWHNSRYLRSLPSRIFTGYGVRIRNLVFWMILLFVLSTVVYVARGVEDTLISNISYSVLAFTVAPPKIPPGLGTQLMMMVETFFGTLSIVLLGYILGNRERF